MTMTRRDLLIGGAAAALLMTLPGALRGGARRTARVVTSYVGPWGCWATTITAWGYSPDRGAAYCLDATDLHLQPEPRRSAVKHLGRALRDEFQRRGCTAVWAPQAAAGFSGREITL